MNKTLLTIKFIALLLLFSSSLKAQEECGADHANEIFFKENPQLKLEQDLFNARLPEVLKSSKFKEFKLQNEVIEIPIVVHVFSDGSPLGTIGNRSDEQILEWIDYTNKLYEGVVNSTIPTQRYPFKLVLAKRTPDNQPTNGIVRIDLSQNKTYKEFGFELESSGIGVTQNYIYSLSRWEPNSYYNVYVFNKLNGFDGTSGTGTNGWAYYDTSAGNSFDGAFHHGGVVGVDIATLGHEIGHALGLYHIFRNTTAVNAGNPAIFTSCNVTGGDDLVNDTSPSINGNLYLDLYGVDEPVGLINKCTNEVFDDIIWNIQNYGKRPRVVFTEGQVNRSLASFNQYRKSFLTSLATKEPEEELLIPITSCVPAKRTNLTYSNGIGIEYISFGDIEHRSVSARTSEPFYSDYANFSSLNPTFYTELTELEKYKITLGTSSPYNVRYDVFIDYNNNGTFEESERVVSNLQITSGTWSSINIVSREVTIPNTAVKNTPLRMRVIGDSTSANFDPCANRREGEVEDYTVIIKENPVTIWDGLKWSNGLPNETKEAIIRGELKVEENNPIIANKFILESGSVIVNSYIKANLITNNLSADKFIVNGKGIYQQNNTNEANGLFTIVQESSPMIHNDATLWSAPVQGQNVRDFSKNTLLGRFYKYDETINGFISLFENNPLYPNSNLENPLTYNFETGIGYHIRASNNQSTSIPSKFQGKFVGNLNNGMIEVPVTKNNLGYNLIGNPYPSSINADILFKNNPQINALYFWTHESPLTSEGYASNNYASYTRAGGVSASAGGVIPKKMIAKGQGFFVEVESDENIIFDNELRVISSSDVQMLDGDTDITPKRIWLDLYENNNAKNQLLISYLYNATNGVDKQIDGTINKMFKGSKLYTLIDGVEDQFVIQGRDLSTFRNDLINIGFDAKERGTFTIKLSDKENMENQAIFLKDKLENLVINLVKSDYTFNSEKGLFNDRFELVFNASILGTSEKNKSSDDLKVIITANGIKINSSKELDKIEIFDINGRKLLSKSVKGYDVLISEIQKNNQVLIINITSLNLISNTTKIIY